MQSRQEEIFFFLVKIQIQIYWIQTFRARKDTDVVQTSKIYQTSNSPPSIFMNETKQTDLASQVITLNQTVVMKRPTQNNPIS